MCGSERSVTWCKGAATPRHNATICGDHMPQAGELWLNLGDAHHQAARFSVSAETSTPSLNLIPSMTFGNWFLPLRRSHFFDAA